MNVEGRRPSPAHVREGDLQCFEFSTAADQGRELSRRRRERDGEPGLARLAPQAAEHIAASGPRFRVAPEEVDAQRVQVVGNTTASSDGAGGSNRCLSTSISWGRPRNGVWPVRTS